MPYPGGVGGPTARPIPFRSRLCLASTFLHSGGFPRSSPRGRLGFAKDKAERTSVFMHVRAPACSEGSQKISKYGILFIILENSKYKYKLCTKSLEFQG